MNPAHSPDSEPPLTVTSASLIKITSLPMDGWPTCFGPVQISSDGTHQQVMLNSNAGELAGKIWKFHPSKNSTTVLEKINALVQFSPFDSDDMRDNLNDLKEFIEMWIIEDGFADHNKRRDFRDLHESDLGPYLQRHSKLRGNIIAHIPLIVQCINRDLPDFAKTPTPLSALASRMKVEGYNDMSFEEKVQFSNNIDVEILAFLDEILKKLSS